MKTREGENVTVERKSGECYQWKAKGQCTKGDARSFCHDESKRGKVTQSSSSAPRPQTQKDGNVLRKGIVPEASVLLEGDVKNRAEITSLILCESVMLLLAAG